MPSKHLISEVINWLKENSTKHFWRRISPEVSTSNYYYWATNYPATNCLGTNCLEKNCPAEMAGNQLSGSEFANESANKLPWNKLFSIYLAIWPKSVITYHNDKLSQWSNSGSIAYYILTHSKQKITESKKNIHISVVCRLLLTSCIQTHSYGFNNYKGNDVTEQKYILFEC